MKTVTRRSSLTSAPHLLGFMALGLLVGACAAYQPASTEPPACPVDPDELHGANLTLAQQSSASAATCTPPTDMRDDVQTYEWSVELLG